MNVPTIESLAAASAPASATAGWVAVAVIALALAVLAWSQRAGWSRVATLAARAAAVGALFATLTIQVAASGWLTRGDGPTLDWMVTHRSSTWTSTAKIITTAGAPVSVYVIVVAIAAFLTWRSRRIVPGAVVLGAVAFAAIVNTAMKSLLDRERPPVITQLVDQINMSYPSGHVAGTTALVGVVLLVYLTSRPNRVRAVAAAAAAVLIVAAIALTRLYLGVHWLSDTIGGALLGTTVVLAIAAMLAARPALDISARPPLATDDQKESAAARLDLGR